MDVAYTAVLLLLLPVVRLNKAEDCCPGVCPDTPSPASNLSFIGEYHEKHFEAVRSLFSLDCCSASQSTVNTTWYKWDGSAKEWILRQLPTECTDQISGYPCDHSQVLRFHDADSYADDGLYKCEATDGRTVLRRNFSVHVFDCVMDDPDYMEVIQQPDPVVQAELKLPFRQKCEVRFGCFQAVSDDSHVWWSYTDSVGVTHNITSTTTPHLSNISGHYSAQEVISEDKTSKTVVLKVDSVSEEDLDTAFTCSATKGHSAASFTIMLREPESSMVLETVLIIAFSAFGIIVISSVVVGVIVYLLWGPTVDYLWRAHFNKLPSRTGRTYDAMVVEGAQEDDNTADIAGAIHEKLEKNYYIYTLHAGRGENTALDEIPECVTIIFIIDRAHEADEYRPLYDMHLAVLQESKCNVIFVVPDTFEDWRWAQISKDYRRVWSNVPGIYTVLRWPGGRADQNSRKCRNFWSKVQRSLPAPNAGRNGADVDAGAVVEDREAGRPLMNEDPQVYNNV